MELSRYLVKSYKLHSSANHHHYAHRIHRHRSVLHSFSSSLVSTVSEKSNSPGIHLKTVASAPENSIFRFLQNNFEQLNNLSTSTMTYENGVMSPQSLQHRQHYPESHIATTMASFIVGSNGTESQQLSSATYDESVFSLLTLRNALIIILYSLIIVVSLPGNLLVCRVAFGTRDMRTTTNLLIASLACSDIVMTGKLRLILFKCLLDNV